jgi:predicted AlkP superfamily pyrophosphatase or phosphodiesterase
LIECLKWDAADPEADPGTFQPVATAYEAAAAAGVSVGYVAAGAYVTTGLSRATTRGARYVPANSLGQLVAQTEQALREGSRSYVVAYHPDLDSTGHMFGMGSTPWRYQLRFVDSLAERIAEVLPPGAALYVTADHGMTNPSERIDIDAIDALRAGVERFGGDPRARYVYTRDGATAEVLATWRDILGDRAWVCSREEAVEAGWFGEVAPAVLPRIGDVIAVPSGDLAIIASRQEPTLSLLVGMHGSMIPAEQLVPLVAFQKDGS